MNQLTEELNNSVNATAAVTAATGTTSDKILQTQSRMELLKDSMQKISDMSIEIEKIIGEINSIAQQTNMLSLNASIEAARAGDMGKGFAVVAKQVGELATRSAQAARETSELIMNSINAVEDGRAITDQDHQHGPSERRHRIPRSQPDRTHLQRRGGKCAHLAEHQTGLLQHGGHHRQTAGNRGIINHCIIL